MSLIQAENTLAFMSAEPAASKMLLGCQSRDRTVDRRGFLIRLATHQLFSSSKEQTAMALEEDAVVCEQLREPNRRWAKEELRTSHPRQPQTCLR